MFKLKLTNSFTEIHRVYSICFSFQWHVPFRSTHYWIAPHLLIGLSGALDFEMLWDGLVYKLSSDTNRKMTCENRRPKRNRLTVRNYLAADWGLIATVTKLVSSFTRWSHANLMTQNWSNDWKQFANVAVPCVQLKLFQATSAFVQSIRPAAPPLTWESPVEYSYSMPPWCPMIPHVPVLQWRI